MSVPDSQMFFDWHFTDISKEDSARHQALQAKPLETKVLENLIDANSLVHFALWSELPKNHPVGELWMETQTDLLATTYLAYGGFFRQALAILRGWFEMGVYGVYFSDHYDQPTGYYEQWRKGVKRGPRTMIDIARALASRQDMAVRVDENTILGKLQPLHSFLSQHVNGQGLDVYDLQAGRDNVPRFLPRSYDIWYRKTLEVFDVFSFLYRVFFLTKIASYLKKADMDRQRAQKLGESLSKQIPEFAKLMIEVTTG